MTALLHEGENVLAFHTLYQGLINRVWVSGDGCHSLLFDLVGDGEVLAKSDESVLTAPHDGFSPCINWATIPSLWNGMIPVRTRRDLNRRTFFDPAAGLFRDRAESGRMSYIGNLLALYAGLFRSSGQRRSTRCIASCCRVLSKIYPVGLSPRFRAMPAIQ